MGDKSISGKEFITQKQINWALSKGKELVKGKHYIKNYDYTNNLFEDLIDEVRESFEKADGNELKEMNGNPPKMAAVYSSSALVVNVFFNPG